MKVDQFPDRIIKVDGEKYLYFGGTAYLGLPSNKKFQKIIQKNIARWGTAYGSSRNANITLSAYDAGETFLAHFIQSEAAVTVSSGMLAGQIALDCLQSETDSFYHFPNTHVALTQNSSLPFFIKGAINPRILDNKIERICILTDAVSNNNVTTFDFSILEKIPKNKTITLVVDESHSLGILGKNGGGIYESIPTNTVYRKIAVASLGKAMGLSGGLIASDNQFIEKIKSNVFFISSAGMNPAFANSLAGAQNLYKRQHKNLKENLNYLHTKLQPNKNILFDPKYPVIYPRIKNINSILASKKIIITNFKYSIEANNLNRIIITANHKKKDLDKIIQILNEYTN